MTKYIVRIETDRIRWIKVKKATRQYISLEGRFYDNRDALYLKDIHSSDAIRVTPIDSNQVGMVRPVFVDPNDLRAGIMSKEIAGTKKKAWLNFDISKLPMILIGIVVGGAVLMTILQGGLF